MGKHMSLSHATKLTLASQLFIRDSQVEAIKLKEGSNVSNLEASVEVSAEARAPADKFQVLIHVRVASEEDGTVLCLSP